MHRSLARYSAPVSFVQAPSWADFITTMVGFEVLVHTGGEPSCGKWNERPGMLIVVGGFRRCQPYLHCLCLLCFRCLSIERQLHQFDWFGLKNRCNFAHDIFF